MKVMQWLSEYRVKQIARNHVCWPCIDKDIENLPD